MKSALTVFAICLLGATAHGQVTAPNEGYWSGPQMFYPYDGVFCDNDDERGGCYGEIGSMARLPKSAPLPAWKKHCEWVDITDPRGDDGWYQWEPRIQTAERAKYRGERVCYFEDRGEPKNINDLQRD